MSNWSNRAFCKCGWSTEPSFGDVWFAQKHYPCCPNCGASAYGYEMKTVRCVEVLTGRRIFFGLLRERGYHFEDRDGNRVEPIRVIADSGATP